MADVSDATRTHRPSWDRWAHDVVLSDGTTVHVRPIESTDGETLVAFHERQSRESIYFRFFSPRPTLSDAEVEHLTTVDGLDRMAFVVERDQVVLGVGRYDRYPDRPVAEVAFFTDDQMGGRGIATLLLEYLAAYAREVGITRFEAMVLPENRKMVRVFRQAGFETSSEMSDGVIEVRFDIEPTDEARAAMAERARRAEREAVVRLLEPRVVAVVGAGRDPASLGHRVLRNLLARPFAGAVHPVHPEAGAVAGVRAYPSVGEIPDPVDLAVVCVPAIDVPMVVEECGRAGIPAAIVIAAGFAEEGPDGAVLQAEVLATARRFGTRILGPNCLGVVNNDPEVRLQATFADIEALPGSVGLLSQSGTLGAVILDHARALGLGISSFVAVGNKADLSGNDLLQYWHDDDRTEVVLLYLESFGNPRRFGRNVRQVAGRLPVFAVRSGAALERLERGEGGQAGMDDATVDALLRQTGVIRVPTVASLLHAALVASRQPVPAGDGVVVVGNSGGSASMAADACLHAGLDLVDLAPATVASIDAVRLHGRSASNPVDLAFDARADAYATVLDAVLVDPGVDVALVVHAPYDRDGAEWFTEMLDEVSARHPHSTIVACVYGPHPTRAEARVPVFDFPDDAAHALGYVVRYGLWRDVEERGSVLEIEDPGPLRADVAARLGARRERDLHPDDVEVLLATGGVEVLPCIVLDSTEDIDALAEVPWPRVAVKSHHHTTGAAIQMSGVALDLDEVGEVRDAARTIVESMGDQAWPIVVQPMVAAGRNVRIEVRTHPVVGSVLRLGPGGAAGQYAAPARRVLPVSDLGAEELVQDAGLDEVLDDSERAHVLSLLRHLAAMVDAAPEISGILCDPVIIRPDGYDIVDAWISLSVVQKDTSPPVRRL